MSNSYTVEIVLMGSDSMLPSDIIENFPVFAKLQTGSEYFTIWRCDLQETITHQQYKLIYDHQYIKEDIETFGMEDVD